MPLLSSTMETTRPSLWSLILSAKKLHPTFISILDNLVSGKIVCHIDLIEMGGQDCDDSCQFNELDGIDQLSLI